MKFIIIDPGRCTGWAVWNTKKNPELIASGTIRVKKNRINPLTQLEQGLKKILKEHQPQRAILEKQYTFTRVYTNKQGKRVRLVGGAQKYAQYWGVINKTISEWGIPCRYLDTRDLPRNRQAQGWVKFLNLKKKKRMSQDEAEAIIWGYYLYCRKDLQKNGF